MGEDNMIVELVQAVSLTMGAVEKTARTSKKEYKERESLRRSKMTHEERSYEDMCKFNKNIRNG
jgi:hypothetical protein